MQRINVSDPHPDVTNVLLEQYLAAVIPPTWLDHSVDIANDYLTHAVHAFLAEFLPQRQADSSKRKPRPLPSEVFKERVKVARKRWKRNKKDPSLRRKFFHYVRTLSKLKQREQEAARKNASPAESKKFKRDPVRYTSKHVMANDKNLQPTFTVEACTAFFRKTYADPDRCSTQFQRESWMPEPKRIGSPMEDKPFSREELMGVLKKKKVDSAPGADAIPYLVWKNYPCTWPYILALLNTCRACRVVPRAWKEGVIKLFYKKGDQSDPSNFRP
ncbi:MAG: hypothetical protein ACK5XN_07935, partial [Bacteroidota bacterium]